MKYTSYTGSSQETLKEYQLFFYTVDQEVELAQFKEDISILKITGLYYLTNEVVASLYPMPLRIIIQLGT